MGLLGVGGMGRKEGLILGGIREGQGVGRREGI